MEVAFWKKGDHFNSSYTTKVNNSPYLKSQWIIVSEKESSNSKIFLENIMIREVESGMTCPRKLWNLGLRFYGLFRVGKGLACCQILELMGEKWIGLDLFSSLTCC